jgi:hypothetical protein
MNRQLKIWNGRGHRGYDKGSLYVAAYSRKQAAELINKATGAFITSREIKVYYCEGAWGNSMKDVIPIEPCVYGQKTWGSKDKPIRIL